MSVARDFYRTSFVLLFWGCMGLSALAQSKAGLPDELQIGIKAGLVNARVGGGVSSYFSPKLMLGFTGTYPSPYMDEMSFKVEVLLAAQGGLDADEAKRKVTGRWGYTYMNIPLLASFTPFKTEKLLVEAGLQTGVLLKARYRDDFQVIPIGPQTRRLDLSMVLGAAYQFKEVWFVDGRIALSFINHSKRSRSEERYYNQTLQLGVGRRLVPK